VLGRDGVVELTVELHLIATYRAAFILSQNITITRDFPDTISPISLEN